MLGVIVVVAVCVVSPRLGVAAPLSLVAVGVGLSFVPGVPDAQIDPEIILAGVLPPLLYASAVTMPITDFRRDLKAIGGLSVVLVIVTSAVLGVLLPLVVPGVGFAEAFALGAIVSPTDAVATSIARRTGAPPRLLTVLDGESMLNDATALVLLRSAVAATGVTVSVLDVGVDLLVAVTMACLVGVVVAAVSLLVRSFVQDATVATAISFVVPFVAYAPAEHLGGSGLVAVVVAGLAIGSRGYVELRPEDRVAERLNWRTIAFLLEGAVFLVMGLQLRPLWDDFSRSGQSVGLMAGTAALVLAVVLAARIVFMAVVLLGLRGDRRQHEASRPRMAALRDYLASPEAQRHSVARRDRALKAIRRREHDITFYGEQSMSARDGLVLTWGGMRGCITVAAAQTLPHDLPQRDLLVLVAFGVAGASLLLQGGHAGGRRAPPRRPRRPGRGPTGAARLARRCPRRRLAVPLRRGGGRRAGGATDRPHRRAARASPVDPRGRVGLGRGGGSRARGAPAGLPHAAVAGDRGPARGPARPPVRGALRLRRDR